jgi:cell wall assembly regulator SMI1
MTSLRVWLERRAPQLVSSLGDPVSEEALRECQRILGRDLPSEYVAFLLQHNGQRFVPAEGGVGSFAPIFHGIEILSLEAASGEYSIMRDWGGGFDEIEARGPVRAVYDNKLWWPITVIFGSSHNHCIDLDPAEGGTVGQIIVADAKDDRRTVIANSFSDFIEKLLAAADESELEITDDGILLPDDVLDRLTGG